MVVSVIPPFPTFADRNGAPIDAGYIYCGTENLTPRSNLISIFSDAALTVALPNPVRTSGGYAVDASGNLTNIYASTQFSLAVADRNNVDRITSPSYGFRVLAGAVDFGAVVIATSILPDAAGGAFNGTVTLPWLNTVTQGLQAKTGTVYNQAQPAVAADMAALRQNTVDVLCCKQTSTNPAVKVNILNTATITRTAAGVYEIVPTIAIPTTCGVFPSLSIPGAGTVPAIFVTGQTTTLITLKTQVDGVDTDMPFHLLVKGNPAVADPIS